MGVVFDSKLAYITNDYKKLPTIYKNLVDYRPGQKSINGLNDFSLSCAPTQV